MKVLNLIVAGIAVMGIYACTSSGKATSTSANSLVPGDPELKAIQLKYADITMQTLNEGYAIYSGPCTKCHRQKKIFKRSEEEWQKSINRMAPKSKLTETQKDALWKYILAMKAAHPEEKK